MSLLRELLYIAWKVDTAERDGNEPLNLEILRKAMLRSMFVTDFTGEFQQSLAAIMQAKGYAQSRMVFFKELAQHLQRLAPQRTLHAQTLSSISQDDIVRTYINPAFDGRTHLARTQRCRPLPCSVRLPCTTSPKPKHCCNKAIGLATSPIKVIAHPVSTTCP